jgi:adenine-specific DNA-methyltransferase
MATVFIGGSRALSRLDPVIRERLDDLIARRCTIFIGDANGADRAVQQHFADRAYEHVIVYCMDSCRNNVGAWETKRVVRPGVEKNFAYYAAKDLAMTRDAACGIMLWDSKSKGTLHNIQNMIAVGKQVLVYFAPEKAFRKLISEEDLQELLLNCDHDIIADAQRQIRRRMQVDSQLSLHHTPSPE